MHFHRPMLKPWQIWLCATGLNSFLDLIELLVHLLKYIINFPAAMILPFSSDHLSTVIAAFLEQGHFVLLVDFSVKDTKFHSRETILQGLSLYLTSYLLCTESFCVKFQFLNTGQVNLYWIKLVRLLKIFFSLVSSSLFDKLNIPL